MKSFKKFLLEQEIPPGFVPVVPQQRTTVPPKTKEEGDSINLGDYETTYRNLLMNRFKKPEEAIQYLQDLRSRRETHGHLLAPEWIIPSLDDKDIDRTLSVRFTDKPIDPEQEKNTGEISKGSTEHTLFAKPGDETQKIVSSKANNPEIKIRAFPGDLDTQRISTELSTGERPEKYKQASYDTLWHEAQHAMQLKSVLGRLFSDIKKGPSYPRTNIEIPAHMSAAKSRYRDQTGINIGPKSSPEDFGKFRQWLQNDPMSSSQELFKSFTDPKTSKQTEELARQVARAQTQQSDTYTA